jgi:hypothetical protein
MEICKAPLGWLALILLKVTFEFSSCGRLTSVSRREIVKFENAVVSGWGRLTVRHRYNEEFGFKLFHCLALTQNWWNHVVGSRITRRHHFPIFMSSKYIVSLQSLSHFGNHISLDSNIAFIIWLNDYSDEF